MFLRALLFLILAAAPLRAEVVIFAASSLKGALDEVLAEAPVRISYGGSGALARQILQGAPADIFFSANPRWMDAAAPAMDGATRVDLLANSLVVIGEGGFDDMLASDGKVATGLIRSVPLGIYAEATLRELGHWDAIAPRLIETDSARAALALVERGEVPFGIVYRTDAVSAEAPVIAELPELEDLPILYPIALTRRAGPEAQGVLDELTADAAWTVFERHGFTRP
ncbi:molybdate ABC transporter substrate-binding protein [Litoreibacter ponti]|nr:molybdate ABC transporter substrate-binding protein [Litoreibacter ponti]